LRDCAFSAIASRLSAGSRPEASAIASRAQFCRAHAATLQQLETALDQDCRIHRERG
jgi:hypothetical protein